jgi:coenzyme F420-reducing hydrogenase beta subunit
MRSGLCIGCGSCAAQSDVAQNGAAQMKLDRYGHYKPSGSVVWLRQASAEFSQSCPFSPLARDEDELAAELFPTARHRDAAIGSFESAYVGYVAEEEFRAHGSSGGMVSWVLAELLRSGLVDGVAHVVAVDDPQSDGRFFRYRLSHTLEEINAGAKSRYYPVEISEMLAAIRARPDAMRWSACPASSRPSSFCAGKTRCCASASRSRSACFAAT